MYTSETARRDMRLRFAYRTAVLMRIGSGLGLLVGVLLEMVRHPAVLETAWSFTGALVGSTLLIMLASFAVQLVVQLSLAMLLTGSPHAKWLTPRQCKGIVSWIGCEWNFYSEGAQRGYRVLGLDVATCGRL